jgi:hypothetical protein
MPTFVDQQRVFIGKTAVEDLMNQLQQAEFSTGSTINRISISCTHRLEL